MSDVLIGLVIGFLFGLFIQPIAKVAKYLSNLAKGEETEE